MKRELERKQPILPALNDIVTQVYYIYIYIYIYIYLLFTIHSFKK